MLKIETVSGTAVPLLLDDIDTDRIIPARYLRCVTFDGLGEHAFEDDRQQDSRHPFDDPRYQGSRVLVAGRNFGCGSSTPAYYAILALGIPAVIAESFAKLFFSNCIGGGLWPVPCAGILAMVETGDTLEIDTVAYTVRNATHGHVMIAQPLPPLYRAMIEAGGEKAYLKGRLQHTRPKA